ncbi:restriction endonuclease subunit S [Xanthomonas translucens pv. undulosa]|uniref:restriction endonuclease subunit S n=1 Tax=Xanthomonas campestris pv. translucens TaxID=343 RepID=UPI0009B7D4B3|nr:restriction endonuclease subunit S [Xanthomonas translucens]MBC3971461.1 restriction endonuclease subunit S [Xanthomonas translucens pv. undulosa]QSQ41608.1 restriction endonuclease subunit S [Xanthomonas translucens pv. translucens]QSQ50520.1 restriction endonuclease subunit S [Xanthomonas translucens pv. undulosa]QSQ56674.1 restriction endonuclease subunit S [Xanthomonas translucens pv. undulosa]UKE40258.1 restriction endonuclease subunit S [Xanthomonas translucens pv. undulosa]
MLPKGWKKQTVEDCADLLTGNAFRSEDYVEAGESAVRLLRGDNIIQGSLRWDDAKYWATPYIEALQRYEMRAGDIVLAMDRPIVNAGLKCSVVRQQDLPSLLVQRVARVRAKKNFDQEYLAQVLQTHRFIEHLRGQKTETAIPHISPNDIREFEFPCPLNSDEQRRIAHILSTWDQAIATTERLLANAGAQRKALTSQLFIHGRHSSMTTHGWKFADFDEIFERVTRRNSTANSNVLTISGTRGLVSQRDYFNKSVASENLAGYTLLERGEFAYNKSYSAGYPMGAIKPLTRYDQGVVSSLYICFRLRDGAEADADFFRHYFEEGMLNEGLSGIAQEGARNHGLLNVGVSDFFKLRLHIPDVTEQRRIAAILNMAEQKELLIAAQLDKLRDEKKALMSQLLTGKRRVRLPADDTASA